VIAEHTSAGHPSGQPPAPRPPADEGVPSRTAAELLDELDRHLRLADLLLAGLADDMAAAGAPTVTERTERVRAELAAARAIGDRLGGQAGS
jgi:hypothetical protein